MWEAQRAGGPDRQAAARGSGEPDAKPIKRKRALNPTLGKQVDNAKGQAKAKAAKTCNTVKALAKQQAGGSGAAGRVIGQIDSDA